jgi:hypothetical protein
VNDDSQAFDVCAALDLDEAAQDREVELLNVFASDLVRMLQSMQVED